MQPQSLLENACFLLLEMQQHVALFLGWKYEEKIWMSGKIFSIVLPLMVSSHLSSFAMANEVYYGLSMKFFPEQRSSAVSFMSSDSPLFGSHKIQSHGQVKIFSHWLGNFLLSEPGDRNDDGFVPSFLGAVNMHDSLRNGPMDQVADGGIPTDDFGEQNLLSKMLYQIFSVT